VPLHVIQDRSNDPRRVPADPAGRISTLVDRGRLREPELSQDCALKPITEIRDQRQPETGSHRHAHITDVGRVGVSDRSDDVERCSPVLDHAVDHDVQAFSHYPRLVDGGGERSLDPFAVIRAVNRQSRHPGLGAEEAGQGKIAVGLLVPAAAVPEQD
jgi:hypothetical protein